MFVTCNAVIGQAVKSWLTICLPAHQNITAYGLSLLIGLGRVAIFAIGLRKNQNDYVKLLIKHTTSTVVLIGLNAFFAKIFNFLSLLNFISSTTLILLGACLIAVGANLRCHGLRTNMNSTGQVAMNERKA